MLKHGQYSVGLMGNDGTVRGSYRKLTSPGTETTTRQTCTGTETDTKRFDNYLGGGASSASWHDLSDRLARETFTNQLKGEFEPYPKNFIRSGRASTSFTQPVKEPAAPYKGGSITGTLEVSYTLSFNPEPEEDVTIKIVAPEQDSEQVFKDGTLVIEAKAKVEPAKYAKDVEWEVEDIQGSEKTIEPQRGEKVKITFDGLPEKNSEFGKKKITARVRDKKDQVTTLLSKKKRNGRVDLPTKRTGHVLANNAGENDELWQNRHRRGCSRRDDGLSFPRISQGEPQSRGRCR